jgi:sigma-B regulation protein RsbU (phosphoserine phosphatase)
LLNELLAENNETNMFVTLYVAILNLNSGRLWLLNGGHLPPLLSRQGSAFEEVTEAKGVLLGVMPYDRFVTGELILQPGDRILFYTDGVSEAENPAQEQFGLPRMQRVLDEARPETGMQDLLDRLVLGVKSFAGDAAQSDDITLLGLRFAGSEGHRQ